MQIAGEQMGTQIRNRRPTTRVLQHRLDENVVHRGGEGAAGLFKEIT